MCPYRKPDQSQFLGGLLRELDDEYHMLNHPDVAQLANNQRIVDSVRVKIAKETGGDIWDAVEEDIDELKLMIGSLRSGGGRRAPGPMVLPDEPEAEEEDDTEEAPDESGAVVVELSA